MARQDRSITLALVGSVLQKELTVFDVDRFRAVASERGLLVLYGQVEHLGADCLGGESHRRAGAANTGGPACAKGERLPRVAQGERHPIW